MTESPNRGSQPRKLLAGGAIKVRIALASGLALTIGAWLAPRAAPATLSASQEHAAPLLEQQVQLQEMRRPFVGVQDVAVQVKEQSVAILQPTSAGVPSRNDYSELAGSEPRVAGFGVFVSNTDVLSHSVALDGRSSVDLFLGGATARAELVAYEPATGLVLLRTAPSGRTPATLATAAPGAGALALAVGRSEDRDVAVPVFVTSVAADRYTVGAVNESLSPGMPVFNLSGELFAVAAPDGREVQAIPVREAAQRLMSRAARGERRSSFGIGFQTPTGSLTEAFGTEGVVITDVIPGGPADVADIRVGDVLLAVGDVPIDSGEAASRAFNEANIGTATTVRVRRNSRVSDIEVTPALAFEIAALARTRDGVSGPEARALFPPEVLSTSAISPLARVLSVNGRTVTSRAQIQREFRGTRRPVPVLLRQGGSQFFIAVEPAR